MNDEKRAENRTATREKRILAFGPAMIVFVSAITGAAISALAIRYNNESLYRLQHTVELRESSYAKLMGLKLAIAQAIQSHLEARLSAETHYLSFRLAYQQSDLDRARSEKDRAEALLLRVSDHTRELFQTLGEVRVAFQPTQALEGGISKVYAVRTAMIRRIDPKQVTDHASLEKVEADIRAWIQQYVQREFTTPIEAILSELDNQLQRERP